MYKSLLLLLVLSVIGWSCKPTARVKLASLHELDGEYLVSNVEVRADDDESLSNAIELPATAVSEAYDLTTLLIRNGNTIIHTHEGPAQSLDTFSATLDADTATYIKAARGGRMQRFRLVYREEDTLDLELMIPRKVLHGREASVSMRLIRLHAKTSLYSTAAVSWMQHPAVPETEAELSSRIQSLLRYDAEYARIVHNSSVGYANLQRFRLPLLYYDGGVTYNDTCKGARKFDRIFYDSTNAATAHRILKQAMGATEYPSRKYYMLEYADFFQSMADYLARAGK